MVTKIFVSQIDKTNADGTNAADSSYIKLVDGVAVWANDGAPQIGGIGYNGSVGFQGSAGVVGFGGSIGSAGLRGPMGGAGYAGSAGDAGTGYTGSLGEAGFKGSIGDIGYQGSTGNIGFTGSLGLGGYVGSVGFTGSGGTAGYIGSAGDIGYKGSAGGAATGESVPIPFTYLTDLSPNTYTSRANYLVAVNPNANGITFIDSKTYIATNTVDQDINFATNSTFFINYPRMKSYSEKFKTYTVSGNMLNLNSTEGAIFKVLLAPVTGSIVTITLPTDSQYWKDQHFSVMMYLKQDSIGGRQVDWSMSNIKWAIGSGVPLSGPVLSVTPNYTDVFTFSTMDNGASWYGFYSAKGINI